MAYTIPASFSKAVEIIETETTLPSLVSRWVEYGSRISARLSWTSVANAPSRSSLVTRPDNALAIGVDLHREREASYHNRIPQRIGQL